jgi:SAM-dependent methyltransferase
LHSDLYDDPALYDALLPAAAHVPYYVDLARQTAGPVLELACGTGQLTVPIAQTGLPTAGLDLSAAMLTAARQLARPSGQRFLLFENETESFGKLKVEATMAYDPATQVGRSQWCVSAPGKPDEWVFRVDARSIFPQELPLLLAAGGFQLKSRMGNLDQTAFDSNSRFQVCLCQVTG